MSHWNQHARQWRKIGPPLRPQAEDLDFLTHSIVNQPRFTQKPPDILLLGVTPEITGLPWPPGSRLLAVDQSEAMIREVWSPHPTILSNAVRGKWCQLPTDNHSFDLIVGDGCMTLMDAEQGMLRFISELRRVLRPGGHLALRLFVRPDVPESPGQVFTELEQNRIGNFHIFKWRLLMALHGTLQEGVTVSQAPDCWRQFVADDDRISICTGWEKTTIVTLEAYRNSTARYYFPTLGEARAILSRYLIEERICTPSYELGDRCPTVIYRCP
ncbi:SAM-dependent methyltransferase, type 11 [Syntrophotalea carbinolica DSM 2380]|uniref:SAM-dependent methyltransferase, type 11 n=1 Tax=Syntrophotalea carbinolica (strain DSM 2380 / NBRC 103641 / GraBd1) TaxID=338963 RepID=Q3A600_SYNC1|nr:class I SAM-dependent methyltransferase [Syntrophotalea carbinolica]ABA88207.1 SAM-dependent methyltransferase, type 11 [Syntrophotalea carbinolica DSM 2380]